MGKAASTEAEARRIGSSPQEHRSGAESAVGEGEASRLAEEPNQTAAVGKLVVGRIQPTGLAHPRVVLAEDSVVARRCSNFSHPITDWSFSLVRKPDIDRAICSFPSLLLFVFSSAADNSSSSFVVLDLCCKTC